MRRLVLLTPTARGIFSLPSFVTSVSQIGFDSYDLLVSLPIPRGTRLPRRVRAFGVAGPTSIAASTFG